MRPVRGPPTLYCDGAAVMRQVLEINGAFPELRRGDHCVIPLNLARGAFRPFDLFIDFLSQLDLIAFHHHFVILDDFQEGKPAYVAEFTNTPADFISKATRVGYSGALFDKADYRKSPLTDYVGGVVYRMEPMNPLTEAQRDGIVSRANKYLKRAQSDSFVTYNIALRNCETIATDIMKPRTSSMDSMNSVESVESLSATTADTTAEENNTSVTTTATTTTRNKKHRNTSTTKNNRTIQNKNKHGNTSSSATSPSTAGSSLQVVKGDSPQINFALWNIFRFLLQCVGVVCLWQATTNDAWWKLGLIGFLSLCALPVLLQSLFLFGNKVHQIRLMWLRGSLGPGSFKHLLFKELFRLILVGFVSTICICSMPFLMRSKRFQISWLTAVFVSLFSYFFSNFAYSILAQGTMSLMLMACGSRSGGRSKSGGSLSVERKKNQ